MPTKKIPANDANDIEETQVRDANLGHPTGEHAIPARLNLGREHILRKYWELANLDPEATKGNITGQLKALDSLCEVMGMAKAAQESDQSSAREIYRSAWMLPLGHNRPAGSA